jgi:hypothetical protein
MFKSCFFTILVCVMILTKGYFQGSKFNSCVNSKKRMLVCVRIKINKFKHKIGRTLTLQTKKHANIILYR